MSGMSTEQMKYVAHILDWVICSRKHVQDFECSLSRAELKETLEHVRQGFGQIKDVMERLDEAVARHWRTERQRLHTHGCDAGALLDRSRNGLTKTELDAFTKVLDEWEEFEGNEWRKMLKRRAETTFPRNLNKSRAARDAARCHIMLQDVRRLVQKKKTRRGISSADCWDMRKLLRAWGKKVLEDSEDKVQMARAKNEEDYGKLLAVCKTFLKGDSSLEAVTSFMEPYYLSYKKVHAFVDVEELNEIYGGQPDLRTRLSHEPTSADRGGAQAADGVRIVEAATSCEAVAITSLPLEQRAQHVLREKAEVLKAADQLEAKAAKEAETKKRKIDADLETTRARCRRVRTTLEQ
jgi:hypothetical protein